MIAYFRTHWLWVVFLFAIAVLDRWTTTICLTQGYGYEANPISAYFMSNLSYGWHEVVRYVCLALGIVTLALAGHFLPFVRKYGLQIVTAWYLGVVITNTFIMLRGALYVAY